MTPPGPAVASLVARVPRARAWLLPAPAAVQGAAALRAECERRLGVGAGRTSPDGAVTLEAMDCAFACGVGPVVEVDHRRRGRVTAGDLDRLLAEPAPDAARARG